VTDHLIISNDKDFNTEKTEKIYASVTGTFEPQDHVQMKRASSLSLYGADVTVHDTKYPLFPVNGLAVLISSNSKQALQNCADNEMKKSS
jgi:hypothetical protein